MLGVAGAATVFAALGDTTLLALVVRLCARGPGSATALSADAGVSRQAIHQHLEILADAGLVTSGRKGEERLWELDPARLAETHAWLGQVSAQWDAALERLRVFVGG